MSQALEMAQRLLKEAFPDGEVEVQEWKPSHWVVRVVSERMRGRSRLERHRLVHAALGDLLKTDVHAVRIVAQAPEESDALRSR